MSLLCLNCGNDMQPRPTFSSLIMFNYDNFMNKMLITNTLISNLV